MSVLGDIQDLKRRVAALEARSGVADKPATSEPAASENLATSPVVREKTFGEVIAWLHSRANGHRAKAAGAGAALRWGEMSRHANAAEAIEAVAELLLAGAEP